MRLRMWLCVLMCCDMYVYVCDRKTYKLDGKHCEQHMFPPGARHGPHCVRRPKQTPKIARRLRATGRRCRPDGRERRLTPHECSGRRGAYVALVVGGVGEAHAVRDQRCGPNSSRPTSPSSCRRAGFARTPRHRRQQERPPHPRIFPFPVATRIAPHSSIRACGRRCGGLTQPGGHRPPAHPCACARASAPTRHSLSLRLVDGRKVVW